MTPLRHVPVTDAELKRRYEAGWTVQSLADEFGWSYGIIHQRLRNAGVKFRPRGGARVGGGRPRTRAVRRPVVCAVA